MTLISIDHYSPAFPGVVRAKNDVEQYEEIHGPILFNCKRGLDDQWPGFRR